MSENTTVPISHPSQNIYYILRDVHRRRGNDEKCIWRISEQEEVSCFKLSVNKNWLERTQGWGLKLDSQNNIICLGISEKQEELKIAKFVDSSSNNEWHGYPADYCQRPQDKPSVAVLTSWEKEGLIKKTQKSKIKQGKKCNL